MLPSDLGGTKAEKTGKGVQRCVQRVPHTCLSLPHELGFVNPNIQERFQVLGNKEPATTADDLRPTRRILW
jgi:hypothetical protein